MVKALQFHYRPVQYMVCKFFGKLIPSLHWHSLLSCIRYQEVEEPDLPNEDWVKIKIKYGGICGSDMNLIFLNDSPTTSPYASFPFTIGHEFVGEVIETGGNVRQLSPGDRVVADPVLACESRGIDNPCPACLRGDYNQCERKTDGLISPGLLIGSCRDTGGSWSSVVVAHQRQVFSIPQELNDLNALLIEPFSCALHSVLRNPPRSNDTVLVIGAGVIGICVVAAIRALDIPCRLIVLAKYPFQKELALQYGADKVVLLRPGDQYFSELASNLDARRLNPVFGSPVIQGGADCVFECAGNRRSLNDALRFAKNRGKVVLLGLSGILDMIDWTAVWLNELTIKGSFAYGMETYKGEKKHTHEIALELMSEKKVDLSPLITHRFPLSKYKEALVAATRKREEPTMKIVLEP